jgi:malonyl-CoA decarboxylase
MLNEVAAEPPRQELLRRLNRLPGGTARIVAMRHTLLGHLRALPELAAVEADFQHLLSSWFNPGFLQMVQVDWNSPAQLLEQLIHHEAVHAIDGWDDLRRRLQPDRRCFAFFHPQLPDEPLIFVEVALLPEMPAAIAPLIDKDAPAAPPATFKVAAFYSISNCQPGLRGVSLGNFLIKRVAERTAARTPADQDLLHAVADPGLRPLAARRGRDPRSGPHAPAPAGRSARDTAVEPGHAAGRPRRPGRSPTPGATSSAAPR